jgi:oxaloacetate decarboxylase beta subunit
VTQYIVEFLQTSGFANLQWQQSLMILIAFVLMYLAIVKKYEPLLLLPIAFGMFLANLPLGGINDLPSETLRLLATVDAKLSSADLAAVYQGMLESGEHLIQQAGANGVEIFAMKGNYGGLLYYLGRGVKLGIYPPLIFLGVGAMTDFAPLIANPKSILLGGAAQLGIFAAFIGCSLLNASGLVPFTAQEAGSIAIIGGADGPTALYLTAKLADHLLGPIAVAAYSYMALVPIIQPPIMKLLTTKQERLIRMSQLRPVTKTEKILFPIAVTLLTGLVLPATVPLLGMLMLGNLMKESGVVERLNKTAQNELMNIVTIFLGLSVGSTATAEAFLNLKTLMITAMGLIAFSAGTAGGVLLAKFMNLFLKVKINPLIGSAGVSAVPMAARVSQVVGQKEDSSNFLLMHAMGPNVAGVIGSAIAAGILLSVLA